MGSNNTTTPPETSVSYGTGTPNDGAWIWSFGAAMIPFTAFCYGHTRGLTVRVVDAVVRSRVGVRGLLLLPFFTLGMEKCIYDTVQSIQGIDPNVIPEERRNEGFPSGGSSLPSLSVVPVQAESLLPSISLTNLLSPSSNSSSDTVDTADESSSSSRK